MINLEGMELESGGNKLELQLGNSPLKGMTVESAPTPEVDQEAEFERNYSLRDWEADVAAKWPNAYATTRTIADLVPYGRYIFPSGRVCESASTKTIFYHPMHPYTRALLTAVPNLALKREKLTVIPGTIPNLIEPPSGCRFHPRCEFAGSACAETVPPLVEMEPEHYVACIRAKEIDLKSPLRAESNE